jgi:hypothetical protein
LKASKFWKKGQKPFVTLLGPLACVLNRGQSRDWRKLRQNSAVQESTAINKYRTKKYENRTIIWGEQSEEAEGTSALSEDTTPPSRTSGFDVARPAAEGHHDTMNFGHAPPFVMMMLHSHLQLAVDKVPL